MKKSDFTGIANINLGVRVSRPVGESLQGWSGKGAWIAGVVVVAMGMAADLAWQLEAVRSAEMAAETAETSLAEAEASLLEYQSAMGVLNQQAQGQPSTEELEHARNVLYQARLQLASLAQAHQQGFSRALDDLSVHRTADVWLSRISLTPGEQSRFVLEGYSLSSEHLPQYLDTVSRSAFLANRHFELHGVTETAQGVWRFSLETPSLDQRLERPQ